MLPTSFLRQMFVKVMIDLPESIDVNKTNGSRECIICYYWYFHEINFRFQLK